MSGFGGCPVAGLILEELLPYIIAGLTIAILTPILLVSYCCYRIFRKKAPVLPAPFQLPIVGCLPFVSKAGIHVSFSNWADKYGKIFACRLGPQKCVVLSDPDLVREAMSRNEFTGRPHMHLFAMGQDPKEPESRGIVMNYGESWKQQRRFALQTFRDLGIGKTKFEDVISHECDQLAQYIAAKNQEQFDIRMPLNSHIANVISTVLFGKDVDHVGEDFVTFVDGVRDATENLAGVSGLMNFFPSLRFLPYFNDVYARLFKGMQFNYNVIRKIVTGEKKSFDINDVGNFTAAYLAKQQSEDGRLFTDYHLIMSLADIFSAGFETTASTLRWAVLYMCLYPEIQKKIQNEIDMEVGRGKSIRLADRTKLLWTEATMTEVARLASIAPIGVPHAATEDTELCGYKIPNKTSIVTNIYYIHHDPKNFEEPDKFKPERFLDEAHTKIIGTENVMPFSNGKRFCPGESLARMELFLFFGTLLQRFTLKFPDDYPGYSGLRSGFTLDTLPYPVIAVPRL